MMGFSNVGELHILRELSIVRVFVGEGGGVKVIGIGRL